MNTRLVKSNYQALVKKGDTSNVNKRAFRAKQMKHERCTDPWPDVTGSRGGFFL